MALLEQLSGCKLVSYQTVVCDYVWPSRFTAFIAWFLLMAVTLWPGLSSLVQPTSVSVPLVLHKVFSSKVAWTKVQCRAEYGEFPETHVSDFQIGSHFQKCLFTVLSISSTGLGHLLTTFSNLTTSPRPWRSWMTDMWVCIAVILFWHVIHLLCTLVKPDLRSCLLPVVSQVKLLGIDASGIADGSPSAVLNLVWNIILHFQAGFASGP